MAANKTVWFCTGCGWFGLMASVTCPDCRSRLCQINYDPQNGSREAARLLRQVTENARYKANDWVKY